jgi:hypothetical protein
MTDIPIFSQMSGGTRFATAGHCLIKWSALGKVGIELLAEFTRPAGACVEAINDGWVNVFHETWAPGRARTDSPDFCEAESHALPDDFAINCMDDAFVLQGMGYVQVPLKRGGFPVPFASNAPIETEVAANRGSWILGDVQNAWPLFWHDKRAFL